MITRSSHKLVVIVIYLISLLMVFFLVSQAGVKAQYYDGGDGGGGGGGLGALCTSWSTIQINNCSKDEFNATPRHPDCISDSYEVTVTINNYNGRKWSLANTDPATTCGSVPAGDWSPKQDFSIPLLQTITTPWTLSSGSGEKKVCLRLSKSGNESYCSAKIEASVSAPTPTPTPLPTETPTPTATPTPGPWYKIKDGSFYKSDQIKLRIKPPMASFDLTDDSPLENYLAAGNAGVVSSAVSPIDILPASVTTNENRWENTNYDFVRYLIANFFEYVKSRKEYQNVSAIDDANKLIGNDTIYRFTGSPPLNLEDDYIDDTASNLVLIVDGNVNINGTDFNNTPPIKSLVIYSTGKISFSETTLNANGVFIAKDVEVKGPTPADDNGLKIKGNLVSETSLILSRQRIDNSKPTLFVVVDPKQYLDLLPLLSTSTYDWQQTQ